jgi:hypothetical protein
MKKHIVSVEAILNALHNNYIYPFTANAPKKPVAVKRSKYMPDGRIKASQWEQINLHVVYADGSTEFIDERAFDCVLDMLKPKTWDHTGWSMNLSFNNDNPMQLQDVEVERYQD